MSITITDTTVDPLLVTDGQSLAAYKGVTVADTSPLSSTGNGFDHAIAKPKSSARTQL